MVFEIGSWSSTLSEKTLRESTFCVSTSGVSPVTVNVSASAPTPSSALTCAVKPVVSSMPSRLTVVNPPSENVTLYTPGTRLMIRYAPLSSVVTVRVRSMSAGLDASTVTPGSTPPDASRTTPAMLPLSAVCARTGVGARAEHTRKRTPRIRIFMVPSAASTYHATGAPARTRSEPCTRKGTRVREQRKLYPLVNARVLEVTNLRKAYASDVLAVDRVSFHVARNEIVGLLGPNGAGKTTTINMILGVLTPTAGSIVIDGIDIPRDRQHALERTNFAAVYAVLPGNLTIEENLRFFD